jgi:hypothetical protein
MIFNDYYERYSLFCFNTGDVNISNWVESGMTYYRVVALS